MSPCLPVSAILPLSSYLLSFFSAYLLLWSFDMFIPLQGSVSPYTTHIQVLFSKHYWFHFHLKSLTAARTLIYPMHDIWWTRRKLSPNCFSHFVLKLYLLRLTECPDVKCLPVKYNVMLAGAGWFWNSAWNNFYHKSAVERTVLLNLETFTFASSSCPKTTSDSLCMICVTVL